MTLLRRSWEGRKISASDAMDLDNADEVGIKLGIMLRKGKNVFDLYYCSGL